MSSFVDLTTMHGAQAKIKSSQGNVEENIVAANLGKDKHNDKGNSYSPTVLLLVASGAPPGLV